MHDDQHDRVLQVANIFPFTLVDEKYFVLLDTTYRLVCLSI